MLDSKHREKEVGMYLCDDCENLFEYSELGTLFHKDERYSMSVCWDCADTMLDERPRVWFNDTDAFADWYDSMYSVRVSWAEKLQKSS